MKTSFPGFPEEMFKFLEELSSNNNRDWFNDNKGRYRSVIVTPVCDFIEAMRPKLEKISPHYIVDARPHGGSMFRIYRDVRFSKDKRPYKEHVGCQFRHKAGKDAHAPGFYVHLAADEILFGGGVWNPPNPVLEKIRDAIVDNANSWKKIKTSKTFIKRFGGIRGDGLKRPPRGYNPEHMHIEDLKRKTIFAMQTASQEFAMSPEFLTEVTRAFKTASPLMEFLTTSLELPY